MSQPPPGQPVPALDSPFGEEVFPNIQAKPSVAQLEVVCSHPITAHLQIYPLFSISAN